MWHEICVTHGAWEGEGVEGDVGGDVLVVRLLHCGQLPWRGRLRGHWKDHPQTVDMA